jgi:hypothetical protein
MQAEVQIKKGFTITPQNYYVYLHIKEDDGTVFYVGKGTKLRWCVSHSRTLHWKNTAKKHGVVCHIVAHNLTVEESLILEKKLIASYGRQDQKTGCLVNLTDGGDGVVNYVWTEEHRKKISEAGMGRKHTEEFKQMVSRIHKGKVLSAETKEKISLSAKGRWTPAQAEARAKRNGIDIRSRAVICLNTGEVFQSVGHTAKQFNLDPSSVSKVCRGKQKSVKGYYFKYLEYNSPVNSDTSTINTENAA